MPKTVEMVVSLKVPDTTAITALQTLQKIGFEKIKDVKKEAYYKFTFTGDSDEFKKKISKVDILINANKHSCKFGIEKNGKIKLFVKNTDDDAQGVLNILKNRLGFKNINKVERATVWELKIDARQNEARKIAEKAAKDLLVNKHYQEYKIL